MRQGNSQHQEELTSSNRNTSLLHRMDCTYRQCSSNSLQTRRVRVLQYFGLGGSDQGYIVNNSLRLLLQLMCCTFLLDKIHILFWEEFECP